MPFIGFNSSAIRYSDHSLHFKNLIMQRRVTIKNWLSAASAVILSLMAGTAQAQCAYTGVVYGTAAAPTASCTPVQASPTCHYTSASGDLAAFTGLVAGNTYTITSSATSGSTTPNTDFLTVYLSTNTASSVASGSGGTVTFVAPTAGTYHVVIATSSSTCGTAQSTCRYLAIQCVSCSPPVAAVATVQPSTAVVTQGTVNAQVLSVGLTNICGQTLTSLDFTLGTTSAAADISKARVYLTTTTTFATTTQFGTDITNPGATFSVTGSQVLPNGANYAWLVFDVSCSATLANVIDASCTNVALSSGNLVPGTPNPAGTRTITALYAPTRTDGNSTTAVQPGNTNTQFVYGNINGSSLCPGTATDVSFAVSGTAPAGDIAFARCYYTTTSTFSTTTPFGAAIANPAAGNITFSGSQLLANGSGNYFWLVYDIACGATVGNTINGDINSITVGGTPYAATGTATSGNAIAAVSGFATVADGDWASPATWACGSIPPSATSVITINHNITVTTAGNIAGDITVAAGKTLTISGGSLTMGTSSAGAASGNSNRLLTINGTLAVTGGTLNLNGGALFASTSIFNMSAGTINVDPNDGTAATSFSNSNGVFSIQTSTLGVTGGNINFLDPAYTSSAGTGQSIMAYSFATTDAAFGPGCTVTFGGGDDQNAANVNGFYVECNVSTGTLEIGNGVVAGGRFAAQREVTSRQGATNYITKFRNLTINSGAELTLTAGSAPFSITGNLVNNGMITNAAAATGSGLFFADCQYSSGVVFGPVTTAQTISGTGFFKKATADADPTAQTGNIIGGLTAYQTTAAPGLTLGMPLTATSFVRIAGGKINTDATNFLALGNGTSLPGNAAVLTASIGTVYGFSATAPTSIATYLPGGWVNGTFKRWVTATTTSGQQGILPLGSDTSRPALVAFTAAPSTAGYLVGKWFDPHGGNNGLPLNEPAVTPSSIDKVANGYWQVSRDATLAGGTYDATFNNTNTASVLDYVNTTLVKRVDASSPWVIEGTHVATTGSNSSPVVKRTGLTNLSEFAIGGASSVVPVTLLNFTAQRTGKVNQVNWTTSQEINTSHFILERSTDGRNFTAIAQVAAAGNSSLARSYSFTDISPVVGMNYYRLKIVDRDNSSKYSWIRSVRNEGTADVSVYPNPVKDVMTISISSDKANKGSMIITDINGKQVYNKMISITQGVNNIPVVLDNVASGSYIVKIQLSDDVVVKKFTKQ